MSSDLQTEFSKEKIDLYLKDLAKEYRRMIGKKMPAEIILIGGASVMLNYGFRDMTTDIDAVLQGASCMKDAIRIVRDRYDLPDDWLNENFRNTSSYTPRLSLFSTYYRTFANVVTVRTITGEYLIAMKLRSGRQYKNDFSDILGILAEQELEGNPLTESRIRNAVENLYGSWDELPAVSRTFIEAAMAQGNYETQYRKVRIDEKNLRADLIAFETEHLGAAKRSNVSEIIELLKQRQP